MDFIHLDIVFPFKHFALHCTKVKVGSKDEASYEFSQDSTNDLRRDLIKV